MPGLLDSLKARARGEKLEDWPAMSQAVATRQALEPQRTAGVKIGAPGLMARLLGSMTGGYAGVLGAYNGITDKLTVYRDEARKAGKDNDPEFLQMLLEHELTHADQRRRDGFLGTLKRGKRESEMPYESQPRERAAFAAEKGVAKKYRFKDVPLK